MTAPSIKPIPALALAMVLSATPIFAAETSQPKKLWEIRGLFSRDGLFSGAGHVSAQRTSSVRDDLTISPQAQRSKPRKSLRQLIRVEVENATVYGLFDGQRGSNANSVARASSAAPVVGLGFEQPLDHGVALNFELFQNTSPAQQRGSFLENTKAALKLRFRF